MKSVMLVTGLFMSFIVNAQYSTKQLDEVFNFETYYALKPAEKSSSGAKMINKDTINFLLKKFNQDAQLIAVQQLLLQRLSYMQGDTGSRRMAFLLDSIDTEITNRRYQYRYNRRDLRLLKHHYETGHPKLFLPAIHNRESLRFYENDSTHIKLFRNNSVYYSPVDNQMILSTEVVNDYFGPIRFGLGFQIKSNAKTDSLSTADSTLNSEKKLDVVSDLKNEGGDVNLNLAFPLLQIGTGSRFFTAKSSLFSNLGFSLPAFNAVSNDFRLNNYGGINAVIYSRGLLTRISILMDGSVGYVAGNKNFENTIKAANQDDPSSFWFNRLSIGLDFNDAYRLQADLYGGNSFVRKNFPATITFTIRPAK